MVVATPSHHRDSPTEFRPVLVTEKRKARDREEQNPEKEGAETEL